MKNTVLALSLFSSLAFANAPITATIYDQAQPDVPIYRYELKKSREGAVEARTAKYVDMAKKDFAIENTTLKDGNLVRYALLQPQMNEEAEVKLTPEQVLFRYMKDGKWREAFEKREGLTIVGVQVNDTILAKWDALSKGETYSFRLAVPDRLETIGFRFKKVVSTNPAQTVVYLEPSSFFIRQLVGPVEFTYDNATKKLVGIKGKTFLKRAVAPAKFEEFKAIWKFD